MQEDLTQQLRRLETSLGHTPRVRLEDFRAQELIDERKENLCENIRPVCFDDIRLHASRDRSRRRRSEFGGKQTALQRSKSKDADFTGRIDALCRETPENRGPVCAPGVRGRELGSFD